MVSHLSQLVFIPHTIFYILFFIYIPVNIKKKGGGGGVVK